MFAIPSYQRYDVLKNKTLQYLQASNVDMNKVYVFCVEEEYEQYRELPCHVVIGKKGLKEQRNFIINFFPENTKLICMDDDIEYIDGLECPLLDWIEQVFKNMEDKKAYLAGVYPCFNPYFRKLTKKDITEDLRFIIGCFYFTINRKEMIENDNFNNKDDYSRTIRHYMKDGIVLRYNKIAAKTKFYGKGGLGNFKDRIEPSRIECELFKEKYPCRIKVRKNGMSEIVFIPTTLVNYQSPPIILTKSTI